MRVFACLPSQSFDSQMPALPKGEPRRRSEPHTCRIRLFFSQTCPRAAPSVTACAVPPSSGRKAFFTHSPNLSLPLGEMSRSDREARLPYEGAGLPPCGKTEGVCQIGKIRMRFALRCTCPRVCPLSHLLRKCQLSQRESREGGANRTHAASGNLLRRLARALLLPSRLAPCHLPQGGRLFSYAQSNLSLPLGEMSRSDREGRLPCEGAGLPLCGKTECSYVKISYKLK